MDTKYTNKKVYYYGNMLQNTEPCAYSATKVFISTLYIVLCLISRKDLTSVLEVQFEEIHFNLQNDYFWVICEFSKKVILIEFHEPP